MARLVRIDLGSRSGRRDVIVVDPFLLPRRGLRADLEGGLPFRDDSVDEVFCYDVLQRIADLPLALQELWRVCKDGALVHVRVPHASSPFTTWMDVTQRRGFTLEAFGRLGGFALAPFDLEYARLRFTGHRPEDAHPLRRLLGLLLEPLANRSRVAQYRCERWWGHWLGFDELYVVLRAVKDAQELQRRRLRPPRGRPAASAQRP
jgi:SAM-dependent methyltransferase